MCGRGGVALARTVLKVLKVTCDWFLFGVYSLYTTTQGGSFHVVDVSL